MSIASHQGVPFLAADADAEEVAAGVSARRIAWTVALSFLVVGVVWIVLTDVLLYAFVRDRVLIARIETAKGWAFVGLAAWLLYLFTRRGASKLARAHATLSAVVESIGDGVLLIGPDRTVRHANPAAARMLGCELQELVGMDAAEFARRFRVSAPDGSLVPPGRFVSERAVAGGKPLQAIAVLHPPGGSELVVSVTAAAVGTAPDGTPWKVVSVIHDVTEAEHFQRWRDQLIGAAAHSLKTPLAIIQANAQALVTAPPRQQRRSIAAIQRQCARIDRLVQNLLVLARARSKTLRLHPHDVDLAQLVQRVTDEADAGVPSHDVHAEIGASPRVYADEERLGLALRNVIDDAGRSSLPGSPVTVLLTQHGDDVEVGVRYRPLPPDASPPGKHDAAGELGLGRCVANLIVEAHAGTLREEQEDPEATEWIRLPRIAPAGEYAS